MHKINLGALKRESLRGTEGEREEKGKEFIKKREKGNEKKTYFLIARKSSQKKKRVYRFFCIRVAPSPRDPNVRLSPKQGDHRNPLGTAREVTHQIQVRFQDMVLSVRACMSV
jgi:hypothetical protein